MIEITHFIVLAVILFSLGIIGVIINTHNLIVMLLSIELILLSSNILFVAFSFFQKNIDGQVFSMFLLAVSAAEAAIGLSIILLYFKKKGTVSIHRNDQMKG
jgi:NADH-quinone oxidoreductase subunit K